MNARASLVRGMVVAAVLGLLGLASCLPVPLGDPAESKADSRFSGVWEWRDGRTHQAIIRPWDEKTFVVDVLTGEPQADGATKPRERSWTVRPEHIRDLPDLARKLWHRSPGSPG